MAERIHPKGA